MWLLTVTIKYLQPVSNTSVLTLLVWPRSKKLDWGMSSSESVALVHTQPECFLESAFQENIEGIGLAPFPVWCQRHQE